MKRFLVVLLSVGLIVGFGASAFAVTPDFFGEYYVWGRYYDNPSWLDNPSVVGKANSTSEWDQRLRIFMRLKVADGLSITTRMDAMEIMWGQDTKKVIPGTNLNVNNNNSLSFEQAWATFATAIGSFNVGIKSARPYGWGTRFQDATGTNPGIEWSKPFGPVNVFLDYYKKSKGNENFAVLNSSNPTLDLKTVDRDQDMYDIGGTYKFSSGDAGLMLTYFRFADQRDAGAASSLTTVSNFQPYVKAKFGPVAVEAEGYYAIGKSKAEPTNTTDVDVNAWGLMVNGRYNLGPAYVGALLLHNSGDDPTTNDKVEGGVNSTLGYGQDKAMFGDYITLMQGFHYNDFIPGRGAGRPGDPSGVYPGGRIDNIWMYQVYGGYSPTKKLDLFGRFSLLKADQDGPAAPGTTWQSKDYGKELDILLTYKIYDALTYNIGGAYLWTGDWFKGTNAAAKVGNTYYLVHYLDLNF